MVKVLISFLTTTIIVSQAYAATTWNTTTICNNNNAGPVFSGGNLTATQASNNSLSYSTFASTNGYSSGKLYFEVTQTNADAGGNQPYTLIGLGLNIQHDGFTCPGGFEGASVKNIACGGQGEGGTGWTWLANAGTVVGRCTNANGASQTLQIAVDISNGLVWGRAVGDANWNNSGTANPATGAGGISISFSGNIIYILGAISGWFGTDVMTLNAGATSFSGTVPVGFCSWDGGGCGSSSNLPGKGIFKSGPGW